MIEDLETILRICFSIGGLFFFLGLGLLLPFRKTKWLNRKRRWLDNLLLNFGNGLFIYIITPISLVGIAQYCENEYLGLFNRFNLNDTAILTTSIFFLDFIIYWQHRLTHKVPFLWRLHRVHHSDLDFDTTTAGRFHPLEIVFSFFIKGLCIITLGLPAEAIILFEIILNFSALFNHSNFSLPHRLEKLTRKIIVTPDMHRVHHSTLPKETNSNYGFCISLWDKLFKSYRLQTHENPQTMTIGLKEFQNFSKLNYLELLRLPFLKK